MIWPYLLSLWHESGKQGVDVTSAFLESCATDHLGEQSFDLVMTGLLP